MEKNEQVKFEKPPRFLIEFKILHSEEQKLVLDRFVNYCRGKGYNRVAAIETLLDIADYQSSLISLATQLTDLTKKVVDIEESLKQPQEEVEEGVETMGGHNISTKRK